MAQFNLNDYETVEQRIARFYLDNPDGRIITSNLTTLQDRQVSTWVVEATVYLSFLDQVNYAPKATGLAFEVDGGGMANKTSALENCETSAIGRALANAGYSGNKRTTHEEMAKVERGVTPSPVSPLSVDERTAIVHAIATATNRDVLREIWKQNADHLDVAWTNSLDEQVTLKGLIMARQAEVK